MKGAFKLQVSYKTGGTQHPNRPRLHGHIHVHILSQLATAVPCQPQLPLNPDRPRNHSPLPHKSSIKLFHLGDVQRGTGTQCKQRESFALFNYRGLNEGSKGELCETLGQRTCALCRCRGQSPLLFWLQSNYFARPNIIFPIIVYLWRRSIHGTSKL